jgi:acetyl esterase/lipase
MNKLFNFLFLTFFITACSDKPEDPNRPLDPPDGYMFEILAQTSYALGMLDVIESKPEVPDDIIEYKNIEYKYIDSTSLQLDMYKHKDLKGPAPILIFIHGGAWRTGKRTDYLPYLIDFANKGYITATLSYRLVKQATYPAAVQDVNCGVKWIKKHADEYGIDPDRMVVIGGSAGGHLALMIGYGGDLPLFNQDCPYDVDSKVKLVVDLYGPVDMTTPYAVSTYQVKDFLNTTYDVNPDIFKQASPNTYLTADDPPTLIFHGTIDSLVPVSQSDSLAAWLEELGIPYDYHRLKGWPHAMDVAVEVNDYVRFYLDAFLEKHL